MKIRLLVFAAVGMMAAQNVPSASALKEPAGLAVLFKLRTLPTSVQIYTCKANSNAAAFAWTGPDPDAIVTNGKTLTIHHYEGPVWEATDGSVVHGSNAKHFLAPREHAVDWLELTATNGAGRFAKVALIRRVDTSGGVPPTTACDASHALEQVRVPYSATYLFYGRE
jgi:Protein of unknown function (DUF3455)